MTVLERSTPQLAYFYVSGYLVPARENITANSNVPVYSPLCCGGIHFWLNSSYGKWCLCVIHCNCSSGLSHIVAQQKYHNDSCPMCAAYAFCSVSLTWHWLKQSPCSRGNYWNDRNRMRQQNLIVVLGHIYHYYSLLLL